MNTKSKFDTKKLVGTAIFAALAIIVSYATSFIKVQFLSLDAGDVIIVLASFIFGPLSGVAISLISALVSFTYSGTGPWGALMDFVSSAAFAFVASWLYTRHRSFKWAIIGIYSSVLVTTLVMIPMNILVTPIYTGAPLKMVMELIPPLLLPFNFVKALFNGGVALMIYKPLVKALRSARLIPSPSDEGLNAKLSAPAPWLAPTLGIVSAAVAVAVLVVLATMKLSF